MYYRQVVATIARRRMIELSVTRTKMKMINEMRKVAGFTG